MLRGLRKASSNWLGKAVMAAVVGFLVISSAIWGLGDIFRGLGRSTVAKIGRTEITVEQFRALYNERLQQFSRQLGRPIGMDQARAMGLDRLVIGQLVSEIVLDETARKLGLNLSDAEVAKQITTDPAFAGPNGQFDRFRFEQTIRNAVSTGPPHATDHRGPPIRAGPAGRIPSARNPRRSLTGPANRYKNGQLPAESSPRPRVWEGKTPSPPANARSRSTYSMERCSF